MEQGEDPWKPRFDRRTGEAFRRIDDYWLCSQHRIVGDISTANTWVKDHDAIHLGRRTVPAPDARPCA